MAVGVGDQEPPVGGHRHRKGGVELGVGGRTIVAAVTRGAGPGDASDHANRFSSKLIG